MKNFVAKFGQFINESRPGLIKKNMDKSVIAEAKKVKFVLYTNPGNSTSAGYVAIGAEDVREVLSDAKRYSDSYKILYQGSGTQADLVKAKNMFSDYRFGDKSIDENTDESRHGGSQTITLTDFEFTMDGRDYICTAEVEGETEYTPSQREEGHGFHELGDFYGISDFTIVDIDLAVAEGDEYVETNDQAEIDAAVEFLQTDTAFTRAVQEEFDPANMSDDEGDYEPNEYK